MESGNKTEIGSVPKRRERRSSCRRRNGAYNRDNDTKSLASRRRISKELLTKQQREEIIETVKQKDQKTVDMKENTG